MFSVQRAVPQNELPGNGSLRQLLGRGAGGWRMVAAPILPGEGLSGSEDSNRLTVIFDPRPPTPYNRNMRVQGYGYSVIGSREMNQDSFLIENAAGLYVVADGVGGGMKGDVASKMAVDGFKALAPAEGSLKPTVQSLQDAIYKAAMDEFGEPIMGTTFTSVRIKDNLVTLCHAGDSRCYLYKDSLLRQLTEDHEAYDERYQGTVLGSYLGIPPDIMPITIQEENFFLSSGECLVLCSDGLYRQMTEPRLVELIREERANPSPQAMLEQACREAAKADYSDNVTIVYIVCED
jgi:serine/threonine protein phosphatase PrpC